MRATRSVGPPGGKPCIIVIGRSGQSGLARTGAAASIAKGPVIAMRRVSSVNLLSSGYPSRSAPLARAYQSKSVRVDAPLPLIPGKAGIQSRLLATRDLGPRFRGDERILEHRR